jgi:Domain of unknown function (DUF4348)
MNNILIAVYLFMCLLISCGGKCKSNTYARKQNENIVCEHNDTTNEIYFMFLKDFSLSPEFQKSRIKFPLQDCYLKDDHSDTCEYIMSEKWIHVVLIDTARIPIVVNVIYNNFNKELSDTDERVYSFIGVENDISNSYYFKRIDGLWYLVKREDFSY